MYNFVFFIYIYIYIYKKNSISNAMNTNLIDFQDFDAAKKSINDGEMIVTLKELLTKNLFNYNIIKSTLTLLFTLGDMENINEAANLQLFKIGSMNIINSLINPLIEDLIKAHKNIENQENSDSDFKAPILSKWWCQYLLLLDSVFKLNQDKKGWGNNIDHWFNNEEYMVLESSLNALEGHLHWKILLLQAICRKKHLFTGKLDIKKNEENIQIICQYYSDYIDNESQKAKLSKEKESIMKYRIKLLEKLLEILEKPFKNEKIIQEAILYGRFDKRCFSELPHSIIIGDDGGFYVLMNSIDDKERDMILEGGMISETYIKNWPMNEAKYKVLIGEGSFGKIRLAFVLINNKTSETMRVGQIICVKKTDYFQKTLEIDEILGKKRIFTYYEIMTNTWSDYSVGDVAELIYSPSVYDMKIIEDSSIILKTNQKGYTMQQFMPVYDGSKAFGVNQQYYNQWFHQKSYLMCIFDVISKLLDRGICMTDLKPQNTLYDGENHRGMLIDLAGVVRKPDRQDLEQCKLKFIREISLLWAAPEFKKALKGNDENYKLDLCKCMSYSLGKIIKDVVLKHLSKRQLTQKERELMSLVVALTKKTVDERISVEEGLDILRTIGNENIKNFVDFGGFMKKLLERTINEYQRFGLDPNIEDIQKKYINLLGGQFDTERYENVQLFDLKEDLNNFINNETDEEKVLVLLGCSGSGKSTILQIKYLETVKNWKPNDRIPIYINLAIEYDIRSKWKWLNKELGICPELNFNIFSESNSQYKIMLFVDSFDEVIDKKNYIAIFLEDLGKHKHHKIMICCRSEFIQREQDLLKWFGNDLGVNLAASFKKRYIAPLKSIKFDFYEYVQHFYEGKLMDSGTVYTKEHIKQIELKIKEKNLINLMNTSFMVHLTLEVLPELMILQKNKTISRRVIYEEYSRKKISKVSHEVRELFKEKLDINNYQQFLKFLETSAMLLSRILHKNKSSRVNDEIAHEFFKRHEYFKNITCLENPLLAGVIRGLDLSFEIRGSIPHEQIIICFSHDTRKNYFLINAIIEECQKLENHDILGDHLIVEDGTLMVFLSEVVHEQKEFKENLCKVIYRAKNIEYTEKTKMNASANAISILVGANVSFSGLDLSNIRINGANLRDGAFSFTDFTDADLTGVDLQNIKLDEAILKRTNLKNIRLGKNIDMDINFGSPVKQVAFSPDGSLILSCGFDKKIKLWDKLTGNLIRTFEGHVDFVNSIAFSYDGDFIISGARDETIIIWETSSGALLKTLKGHNDYVTSVSFSFDGMFILSSSLDKTIKLWEKSTGILLKTYEGHQDFVSSVCFSPDNTLILSGSFDNTIKIWEKSTGNLIKTLENHQDHVNSVVFSHDGLYILSGSKDKTINLWVKNSGKLLKAFKGHTGSVKSVCFQADGKLILSGSRDFTIKLGYIEW